MLLVNPGFLLPSSARVNPLATATLPPCKQVLRITYGGVKFSSPQQTNLKMNENYPLTKAAGILVPRRLFLPWLFTFLQVSRSASVDSINSSGELCSVFLMLLERWKRYVVNTPHLSYHKILNLSRVAWKWCFSFISTP